MRSLPLLFLLACAPPPEVPLAEGALDGNPTIELLYPEPEQEIALTVDCELDVPIVVWVAGIELQPPDPSNLVDGEGHWHGGPSLEAGYCVSSGNSCEDYVGTDVRPGPINLFVELQDNGHNPLEARDQVEVTIVDPVGVACL